ncbi:hypothetical protein LZ32DRAFT_108280 [Colletotrichum eremochloae]|nr:hypothetical protein LY78DRAFT_328495 [Colletotrichum sublineola]KAK2016241.1 hypothetical protein LZ32DRAFT_108280 [Colletotrichum eremochloae]
MPVLIMNYISSFFSSRDNNHPFRLNRGSEYSQPSSRQSTGFSSSTTSTGRTSNYRYEQEISGRFIDRRKLQRLLKDEFGNRYQLQLRSNNYRLCADRLLSEEKILSCY